jgi:hypothetical protein
MLEPMVYGLVPTLVSKLQSYEHQLVYVKVDTRPILMVTMYNYSTTCIKFFI